VKARQHNGVSSPEHRERSDRPRSGEGAPAARVPQPDRARLRRVRSTTAVLCRSSRVGLKGARRWRLLWSGQRPLSERSEDMSVSDRQRRGAFEMCWSGTDSVVAMLFEVVPQAVSAVPSKPAVPPTPVPPVLLPVGPSPLTPTRAPHDSTPGLAAPEPAVRHTQDIFNLFLLWTPPAHVPAPARTREPPSGGCSAARDTPASHLYLPGRQSHADTHSSHALSASLPAPRRVSSGIHPLRPAVCPTLQGTDCQRRRSRVSLVSNRA